MNIIDLIDNNMTKLSLLLDFLNNMDESELVALDTDLAYLLEKYGLELGEY